MTGQRRLFVLEQGIAHPFDSALPPGRHDLSDAGVVIDFDGEVAKAAWHGFFPSVFLLPSPRQLQRGRFTRLSMDDRISWAGREWTTISHVLPGSDDAPIRGICLNRRGTGRPLNGVLLLIEGKDRGNFLRLRTEPTELAPGVTIRGNTDDSTLELRISRDVGDKRVAIDDKAVGGGQTHEVRSEQRITILGDDESAGSALIILP